MFITFIDEKKPDVKETTHYSNKHQIYKVKVHGHLAISHPFLFNVTVRLTAVALVRIGRSKNWFLNKQ